MRDLVISRFLPFLPPSAGRKTSTSLLENSLSSHVPKAIVLEIVDGSRPPKLNRYSLLSSDASA